MHGPPGLVPVSVLCGADPADRSATADSPQLTLDTLRLRLMAEQIYDSVDALARALPAELSTFEPWRRRDPAVKPAVSGFIWTSAGPRRVALMLDTGATHSFICAQLARTFSLQVSAVPGPSVVGLATPDSDTSCSVPQPVVVHLALGEAETVPEAIAVTPLDLGPDLDILLGWDWISTGLAEAHQGAEAGLAPRAGLDIRPRPALSLPAGPCGRQRAPGPHFYIPSALSCINRARRGADQPWRAPPHATPSGAHGARRAHPGNWRFCGGGTPRRRPP